jgi:L-amino acid N-acyltransferase YncA
MTTVEGARSYPHEVRLPGGPVVIRPLGPADVPTMLTLARSLPEHDLLFLARDITRQPEVEDWLASPDITTLGAFRREKLEGYAAIHRNQMRWSAHVAELRVLTAVEMRGKGLGRALTQEAFAYALSQGIEKMMAQMTLDQKGAIAVFEGLGFRPEALLRDHVKDRQGHKHDLLVLSHEVARFGAQHTAFGVAEAFAQ